jgi:hypothetical protein
LVLLDAVAVSVAVARAATSAAPTAKHYKHRIGFSAALTADEKAAVQAALS